MNFLYSNGSGGSVSVSSGNIAPVADDNLFHTYRFNYDNAAGVATVKVDGVIKYSNTGVAGRSIYWTGSGNIIVGKVMDATGGNLAILDNLIISNPSFILPTFLYSFSGEMHNGEVALRWSTGPETTTEKFDIERTSGDGQFTRLQSVQVSDSPTGIHQYNYTDQRPSYPDSYYHLVLVEKDGKNSYSPFVHITMLPSPDGHPNVYPNPTRDHIWIELSDSQKAVYKMSVFGMDGKQYDEKKILPEPGSSDSI